MKHQVLARKWRPGRFEDLVGQPHVVRALTNALASGRLHHAYLFSGTRGVGKTTVARILARCLNCATGVTATPCGQCRACVEIAEGRHLDLIEVDAASRTRVDDTRELLDNVSYAPVSGRYKVYLVDEVHMLSEKSFNALLKTLEEPPPHVVFLLATTDPQKLPVTVLSRCLQFNLKPMPAVLIADHLDRVLRLEGVQSESGARLRLAEAAQGSMRDALSLTDQAIAYSGGALTESEVCAMIGLLPRSRLAELLDAVWMGQGARMLDLLRELDTLAPDWPRLLEELAELVHGVAVRQVLLRDAGEADVDGSDAAAARWERAAARRESPEGIQLDYQILLHGLRDLPFTPDARIGVEMTLLRLLAFRPEVPGGAGVEVSDVAEVRPRSVSAQRPDSGAPARQAGSTRYAEGVPETGLQSGRSTRLTEDPVPTNSGSLGVRDEPGAAQLRSGNSAAAMDGSARATRAEGTPAAPPGDVPARGGLDWHAFAQSLPAGPTRELALNADLLECGADRVSIAVPSAHQMLATPRTRGRLAEALARALGRAIRVELRDQAEPSASTPAARLAADAKERQARAEAELLSDPVIATLRETFGAEVSRVTLRSGENGGTGDVPAAS